MYQKYRLKMQAIGRIRVRLSVNQLLCKKENEIEMGNIIKILKALHTTDKLNKVCVCLNFRTRESIALT